MIKSNTHLIDKQILNSLLTLGLTRKEADAYYTLVVNGMMTAEDISKNIHVQHPIIYRTLEGLKNKGWIDSTSDRPKKYRAMMPKTAAASSGNLQISIINDSIRLVSNILDPIYNESQDISMQEIWSVQRMDKVIQKICEISKRTSHNIHGIVIGPIDDSTFNLIFGSTPGNIPLSVQIIGPPIIDMDEELKKHIIVKRPGFEMNGKSSHMSDLSAKSKEEFLQSVHNNRFISVYISFDKKEAMWINLPYRDNMVVEEKVWANWIIDPEYIEIIESEG